MAVTSLKSPWRNADSMNVYFPGDAGTVTRGGESSLGNGRHETRVEVDLTALPTVASGNIQIVAENVSIPKNAFIERVDVLVTKATTGATAALNADLVKLSDRTTLLSSGTGLISALAATAQSIGKYYQINVGSTGAGALIGTQITTDASLIVVKATTADFTAGKVLIRVYWLVPLAADL